MLKRYRCPNNDCKMYNQTFPVFVKIDGWFYEVPKRRCVYCDHDAEEVKDE